MKSSSSKIILFRQLYRAARSDRESEKKPDDRKYRPSEKQYDCIGQQCRNQCPQSGILIEPLCKCKQQRQVRQHRGNRVGERIPYTIQHLCKCRVITEKDEQWYEDRRQYSPIY